MKVLVVDGLPFVRDFLVAALRSRGHEPHAFNDAKGAWDWFHDHPVALAILDWELQGGMDGRGLCRWIRESHPATYVLMLTGHDTVHSHVEAIKAGADHLLAKPPSLQELDEALLKAGRRG